MELRNILSAKNQTLAYAIEESDRVYLYTIAPMENVCTSGAAYVNALEH